MRDAGIYQVYKVNAKDREPLVQFMVDALHGAGSLRSTDRPPMLLPFA